VRTAQSNRGGNDQHKPLFIHKVRISIGVHFPSFSTQSVESGRSLSGRTADFRAKNHQNNRASQRSGPERELAICLLEPGGGGKAGAGIAVALIVCAIVDTGPPRELQA
jgi:hypothetical protein